MVAKSLAARQQAFRDRREASGLERHEIYCYPEDWHFIYQQVKRLTAVKRGRTGKGKKSGA